MLWKWLWLAFIAFILIGLAVMGEWLGLALVLIATAINGDRMARTGWPRSVRFAVSALAWGVSMEGFFTVLRGDSYRPLGALIAGAAFGVSLAGLLLIWSALRARRKEA